MFDAPNSIEAFERFGKRVVKQSRENLTRGKHGQGNLYNKISFEYTPYQNGFRFIFKLPYYAKFLDEGVKGVETASNPRGGRSESIRLKKPRNSPFKFGSGKGPKGGLTKAIDKWVRAKNIKFRNKKGQFITRDSTAFLIRRSIWLHGLPATYFFSRPLQNNTPLLVDDLKKAFKLDVLKFQKFIKKEIETV